MRYTPALRNATILVVVALGALTLIELRRTDAAPTPATTTTVRSTARSATPSSPAPYPNETTTGVPADVTLAASNSITVSTDGAVIDGQDVSGCITVNANDVTISRTRVRMTACYGFPGNAITNNGTNLTVVDTEIDGRKLADCGQAIGNGGYTLERVDIHDCSDGPRGGDAGKPVTILDSYIHNLFEQPGDHGDGYQCYAGRGPSYGSVPTLIRHNRVEGGTNAAVYAADFCDGPMTLDDNLLSGGGYTIRLYDQQVTVTNNVVVRGTYTYGPVSTYSGPQPSNPDKGMTSVVWTNNRIADNPDGTGLAEAVPPA